jgi:hypothetical protein
LHRIPATRYLNAVSLSIILVLTAAVGSPFYMLSPVQQAEALTPLSDFNGDGFEDLAIGIPSEDVGSIANAGAVNVIYGSASGLSSTVSGDLLLTQYSVNVPDSAEADDGFGDSLATGDFNGDNYADLAIGVPHENVGSIADAGAVHIIYGSSAGLKATAAGDGTGRTNQFFTQDSSNVENTNEADDLFGSSLATGDFNGDGRDDLAIGAPNEDVLGIVDSGAVNVLYGSSSGLSAVPVGGTGKSDQWFSQTGPENESGDKFGFSIATGKFNGDSYADLAIGVLNEDGIGTVKVIYGSGTGLGGSSIANQVWCPPPPVEDAEDCPTEGRGTGNYGFGYSLATGDFNGDGRSDLAIGEPFDLSKSPGLVWVIFGSNTGLTQTGKQVFSQASPDLEYIDGFGESLAAGNFNGDKYFDLAIGAPAAPNHFDDFHDDMFGNVNVRYGSSAGLSSVELWSQDSPNVEGVSKEGDGFGSSLAAGKYNNGPYYDLAIGVPGDNAATTVDAGSVNVIYGFSGGLSPTAARTDQIWHQNTAGIDDAVEKDDRYGTSLASG